MTKTNNKMVSEVVWPWRKQLEPSSGATADSLRKKAAQRESFIMLCVSVVFYVLSRNFERCEWMRHPASFLPFLAVLVFVGGIWVPPLYKGIKWFFDFLGKTLGTCMAWLLLTPFFFLCFPIGRLGRFLKGKDTLGRKFHPDRGTYWEPWEQSDDRESYRRQF